MTAFLLGFLTMAWLATLIGVAYVLWRYAYTPFTVVRRDVGALNARFEEFAKQTEQALDATRRRVAAFSDAELASVERRLRRESGLRAQRAEHE